MVVGFQHSPGVGSVFRETRHLLLPASRSSADSAKQPVCPTHRFSSQSQRALHDTQEKSLKSQNGDLAQKLKIKQGCTWEKNCSEMIQDVT